MIKPIAAMLGLAVGAVATSSAQMPEDALNWDIQRAVVGGMISNGCWKLESRVLEGRNDLVIIAVRFGPDGKFSEEPRLVSPVAMPADDPVLRDFIQQEFEAVKTCKAKRFELPPKYFEKRSWVNLIVQARPTPYAPVPPKKEDNSLTAQVNRVMSDPVCVRTEEASYSKFSCGEDMTLWVTREGAPEHPGYLRRKAIQRNGQRMFEVFGKPEPGADREAFETWTRNLMATLLKQ